MAADGKNFKKYEYTDDDGNTHNLRVEKTVGDDADFGFAAYDGANPEFIRTKRNYPRTITMMDPNTGRTLVRPVGNRTCDAWTQSPFTEAVAFPGKADTVNYTRIRKTQERLANPDQVLRNLTEPAADA